MHRSLGVENTKVLAVKRRGAASWYICLELSSAAKTPFLPFTATTV